VLCQAAFLCLGRAFLVNATFNGVDEVLTESADWCISSRPIDVTSISVWLQPNSLKSGTHHNHTDASTSSYFEAHKPIAPLDAMRHNR